MTGDLPEIVGTHAVVAGRHAEVAGRLGTVAGRLVAIAGGWIRDGTPLCAVSVQIDQRHTIGTTPDGRMGR